MIIENLDLDDSIYVSLEAAATERGVKVLDLIRWVLGDYARLSAGPTMLRTLHTNEDNESKELLKLSGMFMKAMIKRGDIKCGNCTMPLNLEDIEKGRCSNCDTEI